MPPTTTVAGGIIGEVGLPPVAGLPPPLLVGEVPPDPSPPESAGGGGSGVQRTVLFELDVGDTVCLSVFPSPGKEGGDTVVNCVTGFLDVITAVVIGGVRKLMDPVRVSDELSTGTMIPVPPVDSPTPMMVLLVAGFGPFGKSVVGEASVLAGGGSRGQTGTGGVNSGFLV